MKSRKFLLIAMVFLMMSAFKMTAFAEDLSGYASEDIAAINNIIDSNGLQGYEKDAPSTWNFVERWTNVSGKKYVQNFNLNSKSLTGTLDVSGLSNLRYFYCENNDLTGLNVSGLTKIETIYCKNNNISSLDVSGLTTLKTIHCSANAITSLDLSELINLENLWCFQNTELTNLTGLQNCTSLKTLSCGECSLETLDVTVFTNLNQLNCSSMNTKLKQLTGLVNKANLTYLNCSGNELEQLDVSGCNNLKQIFCSFNSLSEIRGLNDCTAMTQLDCHVNKLNALDLSAIPDACSFKYIDTSRPAEKNCFTEVTFRNGKVKIESTAGGTAYINEIKLADQSVSVTTVPDTGCVFAGWYTDAAMTEENKVDFNGSITADITLYPKFSPIISNITVSDLPSPITYGDTFDMAITGLTVADGYNADDVTYKWYEGETELGTAASYTYTANDISEHTISCDISIGGYKVTKTFTFTPSAKTINTDISLTAPEKNAAPQTSITTDEYTAAVTWSPLAASLFSGKTVYTATITITPNTYYTTNGIAQNGYTLTGAATVENDENSNVVTAVFPETSGGSGRGSRTSTVIVSFDSNGGSKVSNQTVTINFAISEPTAPTRDGYDFAGWYTDKELKNEYNFSSKVTRSFTLYAAWTEKEDSENQIILTIGEKSAKVFGVTKTNDVAPLIRNDRTMLPARFVAENLGATVSWSSEKQEVSIFGKNEKDEDVTIYIYIDSDTAFVNGKQVKLDAPAFIENDRTYTPIRFISEHLGANVDWNETEQKVIITKPSEKE